MIVGVLLLISGVSVVVRLCVSFLLMWVRFGVRLFGWVLLVVFLCSSLV